MQVIATGIVILFALGVALAIVQLIFYAVVMVVGVVLGAILWLGPCAYYVVRDDPDDQVFWLRIREIISMHLVLLLAIPFMFLIFNTYNQPNLVYQFGKGVTMNPMDLKAILYAAFVFVFSFGFSAYFLKEIFPWKSVAPVFNNFLSFLSAFFLASFTALVVYDGKSTSDLVQNTANRFSDFASTALSILFLMMGVYLFWKKVKAYF